MPATAVAPSAPARITLLTDFGTRDGYTAAMKGVIAARAPHAIVDDASHHIPPGDVHAAAWAFAAYWNRYPAGTIHIVVVDPGVGTRRRALAVRADGRTLIGPDNGVFTLALAQAREVAIVSIENAAVMSDVVSATFHGRDIFAPAAAHIACGGALGDLGPPLAECVRLEIPSASVANGVLSGEVVHVDRFGNLITNITAADAAAHRELRIEGVRVPVCRTYGDVPRGALCALVGSAGVIEISVRDGSAADVLGCGRGCAVTGGG